MDECPICKKLFTRLCSHMIGTHNYTKQQYYDTYIKKPDEGICPVCNNKIKFNGRGYHTFCSCKCSAIYRQSIYTHNDDVKQFEKENNCINIVTLREIYGQGWYKANIIKNYIIYGIQTQMYFVSNDDILLIEEYCKNHKYSGKSHKEKLLVNQLKQVSINNIIENDKHEIYPKELDIYIPDLRLAIEYNGTWHHSIEAGKPKEYHLNKSLCCREKGIRLIHIYEFEDFNEQIQLLKDLILGYDNYPKDDFNKNNLIENIPIPELIHVSNRGYHVYGAGKLVKGDITYENNK